MIRSPHRSISSFAPPLKTVKTHFYGDTVINYGVNHTVAKNKNFVNTTK